MRLLNTRTFELQSFVRPPPYAILSHTWGDDEVLFEDVQRGSTAILNSGKRGLAKVVGSCAVARDDGWEYIWIDTCCIDKSSSAELSEAINSMFLWYANSQVCYVYLADCEGGNSPGNITNWDFRWCTRGWTLQELIAPYEVRFYSGEWDYLGTRLALAEAISTSTGIDKLILQRHRGSCPRLALDRGFVKRYALCSECQIVNSSRRLLDSFSIATRMSWVASRKATRDEDIVYCLMGLFDVNMPLLYGEGCTKAFGRLQQQIVSRSNDQSILVWGAASAMSPSMLLALQPAFAVSPASFRYPCQPVPELAEAYGLSISGFDLVADVLLGPGPVPEEDSGHFGPIWIAFLNCNPPHGLLSGLAILLAQMSPESLCFHRVSLGGFLVLEATIDGFLRGVLPGGQLDESLKIPFDSTSFRKEQIRMKLTTERSHLPISRGLRKTTPPLIIQISNTSSSHPYSLVDSVPPTTMSLPTTQLEFSASPVPDPFNARSITVGAAVPPSNIVMSATVLSGSEGYIVVLCGVSNVPSPASMSLTEGRGVDLRAYLAYRWWQGASSTPFSLVMPWEDLVVATGKAPDGLDSIPPPSQKLLLERVKAYSIASNLVIDLEAPGYGPELRLSSGTTITARIEKVDFLQRKSLRVSIKISE